MKTPIQINGRSHSVGLQVTRRTHTQSKANRAIPPQAVQWVDDFLSPRAPLGFEASDENLYRYVKNDPVNGTDPSGLLEVSHQQPNGINELKQEWDQLDRVDRLELEGLASRPISAPTIQPLTVGRANQLLLYIYDTQPNRRLTGSEVIYLVMQQSTNVIVAGLVGRQLVPATTGSFKLLDRFAKELRGRAESGGLIPLANWIVETASAFLPGVSLGQYIDNNIARLGSENWRERDMAQKVLATLGPLAVARLETARRNPDPEIARAASQILESFSEGQLAAARPIIRTAFQGVTRDQFTTAYDSVLAAPNDFPPDLVWVMRTARRDLLGP